jgi:glyoxylase-like metal-dependent hydrolase (beta-lactamase superfamily II)
MQKAGALDADDVLILCFQSYIVKTPHHTILVDSCIGNDKPRPLRPKWNMKTDDSYMRALAAAGFSVGSIDFVMCTHLHVDHVGWNTRLENGRWVPTFPNARYVFGKGEFDYWTEQNATAEVPPFADSVLPIVNANKAEIVRNDYAIGDHVRILPTPGHTPGHVAFTFGRGKDDAVFAGDLMHSPLQTHYPELSAKFDIDQAEAAATRRSFLERYCDTDTLCCTAHFPSPSTGRIRRKGNGFSCEPVTT